jgi:hypothetical protein
MCGLERCFNCLPYLLRALTPPAPCGVLARQVLMGAISRPLSRRPGSSRWSGRPGRRRRPTAAGGRRPPSRPAPTRGANDPQWVRWQRTPGARGLQTTRVSDHRHVRTRISTGRSLRADDVVQQRGNPLHRVASSTHVVRPLAGHRCSGAAAGPPSGATSRSPGTAAVGDVSETTARTGRTALAPCPSRWEWMTSRGLSMLGAPPGQQPSSSKLMAVSVTVLSTAAS